MLCAFCAHAELAEWLKHADDGQGQPADRRFDRQLARREGGRALNWRPPCTFMPIAGCSGEMRSPPGTCIATGIRSRRCRGVSCVRLNSWGDNPTAEAK